MSAKIAGDFIQIMIPGAWGFCQTELLRRFLGTQGAFYIVVNSQIVNCILHPLWLYIFVSVMDLSVNGVALATDLTYILNYLLPIIYIQFHKSIIKEDSWHCINKDSFIGLLEYLKYGVPSMLMIALEYWAFELLSLLSGLLGEVELGASIIIFNITAFAYMLPLGFSFASNTLIGNNLGASKPKNAKTYLNISVAV